MKNITININSIDDLASFSNYSLVENLNPDPQAREGGFDHNPRQVFTGHYVPVKPTPIPDPEYILHSEELFRELGFSDDLSQMPGFVRMFSGDISHLPSPMRTTGWATGYALSIYGREFYQQCPFQTGNGYGDGRAVSIFEGLFNGRRLEMQLKGGGRTPYCRGADGRAVLRSSIREFLAQEAMHALGVPTSRSLSLYVSQTEKVKRPWYSENSTSEDPDMLVEEAVAITTRVASSFLRVGQLELFGRRARKGEHAQAMKELEQFVVHLIDREYSTLIDKNLPFKQQVLRLAAEFLDRLTALVANWIRVGYCQGNFNSDNCALGGFTLDYGPFGFCDDFDPRFQPWTGGGDHFSFLNQPEAAFQNYKMFCLSLSQLFSSDKEYQAELAQIQDSFSSMMNTKLETMWASKLGLEKYDGDLVRELLTLMVKTSVDYTIFFRELSKIPNSLEPLKKSFYHNEQAKVFEDEWAKWFAEWRSLIEGDQIRSLDEISKNMNQVNPKYILREWFLAPAYQQAQKGDYSLVRELNEVMTKPYDEQAEEIAKKYYKLKPTEFFNCGGVSHLSCSS